MSLDPSQQRAVELILSSPFGLITGGPGTGKTHCLKTALDALDSQGCEYLLAAPTGKAARRMFEATGREALTVHRLLEYDPQSRGYGKSDGFLRHADNPLEAHLIVVDEASMLDVKLAAALFDACQSFEAAPTRLILVGDRDQLPPVGAGCVFSDLIASGAVPVARLTTLHRSAAASWVATQSRELIAGRGPDLEPRHDFRWIERSSRDDAVDALVELATGGELAEAVGLDEHQVIVPQNVGPAGAEVLNGRIQALLTPPSARGWKVGKETLRVGDRVIQTRNDYKITEDGVMNGEIGVVAGVDDEALVVRFEAPGGGDLRVEYTRKQAKNLRLAYALTCHKMQGSETPWAVVLVHSTHTQMLSRRLLYTAITRARVGVVLVGDATGLARAVKNVRDAKRNSGLIPRLREAGLVPEESEAA